MLWSHGRPGIPALGGLLFRRRPEEEFVDLLVELFRLFLDLFDEFEQLVVPLGMDSKSDDEENLHEIVWQQFRPVDGTQLCFDTNLFKKSI